MNHKPLALVLCSCLLSLFVSPVLSCPLFVRENAVFMTNMEVTPLNRNYELIYDEYHQGMIHFNIAANERYDIEIRFYLTSNSVAAFIKIFRCADESFPELYRIAFPSSSLSVGWNAIIATLYTSDISEPYHVRVAAVAGHRDDDGSSPWNGVIDENFGANIEDWNFPLGDGCFAGRAAEELDWDNYEIAYEYMVKVEGLRQPNPWLHYLSATPSKTVLLPGEPFSIDVSYYRTRYCPGDYFRVFCRNEATGEITELYNWQKPYWMTVSYGWQYEYLPHPSPINSLTPWPTPPTIIAPTTPGMYTVRIVGCIGYPTADWYATQTGGFASNRAADLSWTLYEQMAEFTITVTPVEVSITVTSSPVTGAGFVKVDGVEITTPTTFTWIVGETHELEALSPVPGLIGTQYVWTHWSDGGDQTHIYTVPSVSETVTAYYKAQYSVIFTVTGMDATATGTVATINSVQKTYSDLFPAYSFWADSGDTVTYSYESIVSSSVSGKRFRLDSVTGPTSPFVVTAPVTVRGNYVVQYYLTVKTRPEGLVPAPTPPSGWFDACETVPLWAYQTATDGTRTYVFAYWSINGDLVYSLAATVHMDAPKIAVANYFPDPPGDVNLDGIVDMTDIALIAYRYGTRKGDAKYNYLCDINGDGQIDLIDLATAARNIKK